MPATLYQPLFLMLIAVLCIFVGGRYFSSRGYTLQVEGSNVLFPFLLCSVVVFWIGLRPVNPCFGDTISYALSYKLSSGGVWDVDWTREWVWGLLMNSCKNAGFSVNGFFLVVEIGYVLSVFWAVKRMMPENTLLGLLFVFASLSYFTYGVNGLRNGLACHLVLLALTFILSKNYPAGIVLCLMALGIHRSVMLPIAAMIAGIFLCKDPKYSIYFWVASIFVSLAAGGAVTSFFASLGFDDRMSSYTDASNDMSGFSRTGFRWDFLLYSAMPVWMAWYVCVKKQVADRWYNLIATIYCLSNSFWIMVIRSSFSNRFAYLSWFIYPLVIAYPLANLPVWEDQDKKIGVILLAYCGFTLFMNAFYW